MADKSHVDEVIKGRSGVEAAAEHFRLCAEARGFIDGTRQLSDRLSTLMGDKKAEILNATACLQDEVTQGIYREVFPRRAGAYQNPETYKAVGVAL